VEKVGIHDNFFELGGDSIKTIQIVSRAGQKDLHFTVKQIFEHQTVAELSGVIEKTPETKAEQGLVTGPIPLTPIQHRHFNQKLPEPHYYNQSMLLEVKDSIEPSQMEGIIEKLLHHHDVLRLRFKKNKTTWHQEIIEQEDIKRVFSVKDLSQLSRKEEKTVIEEVSRKAQTSLNLEEGPLIKVILFQTTSKEPDRLLIIIHHLAIDGVSWRVLLEDIQRAHEAITQDKAIQLPPKTTSFKEWSEKLREFAKSPELQKEVPYWLETSSSNGFRLPIDHLKGKNTKDSLQSVSLSLTKEETKHLLQEVPKSYHTQINDILLTALVKTLSDWTGKERISIDLEGHGREEILEKTDISRTLGWFTSIFPVSLEHKKGIPTGETIKSVKEQLRQIPNKGIGYGLIRYLCQDKEIQNKLQSFPHPEISFNYLGQFTQTFSKDSLFQPAKESPGPSASRKGERPHAIDINSSINKDRFQISFTYSQNLYEVSTIDKLAKDYLETLQALIRHCLLPESFGWTPSDFSGAKSLTQEGIDNILNEFKDEDENEE